MLTDLGSSPLPRPAHIKTKADFHAWLRELTKTATGKELFATLYYYHKKDKLSGQEMADYNCEWLYYHGWVKRDDGVGFEKKNTLDVRDIDF